MQSINRSRIPASRGILPAYAGVGVIPNAAGIAYPHGILAVALVRAEQKPSVGTFGGFSGSRTRWWPRSPQEP